MNGILYSKAQHFRNFVHEKKIFRRKIIQTGFLTISMHCILFSEAKDFRNFDIETNKDITFMRKIIQTVVFP